MGSLECGVPMKKGSSSRAERQSCFQWFRSKLFRLLLKKIDYVQWVCTILVFLFVVVVFQMWLPGSVIEKSESSMDDAGMDSGRLLQYQDFEKDFLAFGEGVKFVPTILEKFSREASAVDVFNKTGRRFGYRKAQLALVFGDLLVDPQQLLMATVATALFEIGYAIQVYSLTDGPARRVWMNLGLNVKVIETCDTSENAVDWLRYDGLVVNSLKGKGAISCLLQEPFKSVPVIWTIHENSLALRSRKYSASGQIELLNEWQRAFNRSTVVVFPNYALPVMYSTFDAGNFYVIPGSPAEALLADSYLALRKDNFRMKMGYGHDEIVIAIVGSKFLFRGSWIGHAIVLQALSPLVEFSLDNDSSIPHFRIVVLSGDLTNNYSVALEATAHKLNYPRGVVAHVAEDSNVDGTLEMADIVIYGSFLEEPSFPEMLMKAMCFGKPIIAPNISAIRKHVDDRVHGYLFPKENSRILTEIVSELISTGKLSRQARNVASLGRNIAKNMLVSETTEGFSSLLQTILKLPSEVAPLKIFSEVSSKLKEKWQWHLFRGVTSLRYVDITSESFLFLDNYEEKWNLSQGSKSSIVNAANDLFIYSIWEEQKYIELSSIRRRRQEEELKDRKEQYHGTWEAVYRNAKRADRTKNDLHERDEGELERTGQPLTIYEPFFGEGTWPFLHKRSLYRGVGLSTKGRRPGADDVDAPSRLRLLNNPYYRDVLGEYGAFFAIANRTDRIHKNAWIGFHSWRATARKESLSITAENALLNAIQSQKYGDALYFWVRMDKDPRNPSETDFWSFCDRINAGNCRVAFSETLKQMYGIKHESEFLPPMQVDGDTWSVMQCWALPTRSFLEFVMFSRMFIDALDAQMYDKHHSSGHCVLSLAKDRYCYPKLLELLVNVWAYHSARRMIYVNPETGMMQEQHRFESRRGHMWIKWFTFSLLKSMDEDLAELSDSEDTEGNKRRWLWPLTGEVLWQGVYERERDQRNREREKRKQKSREKISRMRKRHHQKVIGKYIKPPPDDLDNLNATTLAENTTSLN